MDWFNNDIKKYLGRGERILFSRRTDSRMLIFCGTFLSIFLAIFFTAFISIFAVAVRGEGLFENGIFMPVAILSALLLAVLFRTLIYLNKKSYHFVLTSRGIYSISGLLVKSVKFVSYNRITDVDVRRGMLALKFDTLTIGVSTASGGNINKETGRQQAELEIMDISDYEAVLKYIMGKIK